MSLQVSNGGMGMEIATRKSRPDLVGSKRLGINERSSYSTAVRMNQPDGTHDFERVGVILRRALAERDDEGKP